MSVGDVKKSVVTFIFLPQLLPNVPQAHFSGPDIKFSSAVGI